MCRDVCELISFKLEMVTLELKKDSLKHAMVIVTFGHSNLVPFSVTLTFIAAYH